MHGREEVSDFWVRRTAAHFWLQMIAVLEDYGAEG